jgi:hypothetical protein
MRYRLTFDASLTSTSLELIENCHTDTTPLLRRIFFHNAEFDVSASASALAAALLTRNYCGELAEFERPVGVEYARAIGLLAVQLVGVSPINGLDRSHATAERDIICAPARLDRLAWSPSEGIPLMSLDWSGDFIVPGTNSSTGYRQGRYFTNAGVIADETTVSIAVGLMHSGGLCRNLIVPLTEAGSAARFEPVCAALELVGIALRLVPS